MTDYERIRNGLYKYASIMNKFNTCDVSKDKEFQRMFNGFYRIRRNEAWRKVYYDLFEKAKTSNYTYEDIITYIYNKTGMVEASFSSKMFATINSNKPIWDKYVLEALGVHLKQYYRSKQEQLQDVINNYKKIEKWYENIDFNMINKFDVEFPEYKWISDVKKCDFLIWGNRDEDTTLKDDVDVLELINEEISKIRVIIDNNEINNDDKKEVIIELNYLIDYLNRNKQ